MKDILVNILGSYEPIVPDYLPEGITELGIACCDWEYILGSVLFIVCIASLFRLLTYIFRK